MKTLIHRLGYGLAFSVVILSCSQPESEEPVIDTSRDVIEVSGDYMAELMTAYKTFVESLSDEEKSRLQAYVNTLTDREIKNGRTSVEALCRCLANQVSCYARSNISECCICYDPKTQIGACGLYFGIAVCRLEPIKTQTPDKDEPSPIAPTIRIYPQQLKGLVDYIDKNNLGRTSNLSVAGLSNFKQLLSGL